MIAVVALLAVTTVVYNVFTPVVAGISPVVVTLINDMDNSSAKVNSLQTIEDMANVWKYWPTMIVFGLVLWTAAAATRRETISEG